VLWKDVVFLLSLLSYFYISVLRKAFQNDPSFGKSTQDVLSQSLSVLAFKPLETHPNKAKTPIFLPCSFPRQQLCCDAFPALNDLGNMVCFER